MGLLTRILGGIPEKPIRKRQENSIEHWTKSMNRRFAGGEMRMAVRNVERCPPCE